MVYNVFFFCSDAAMDLAIYLIQTCVIQDNIVSAVELSNVVDALAKVKHSRL